MTTDFVNNRTTFDSSGDNSAQAAAASGAYLSYIHVINPNTAQAFLQLFDVAAADVTVGTTTPKQSYLIPAGDGVNSGAFEAILRPPLHFSTAITYACTNTATGNGNPATGLTVNLVYH